MPKEEVTGHGNDLWGASWDWMRNPGRLPWGFMVTGSLRMKGIPKGTSKLEAQLACHHHPEAGGKIKDDSR